LEGNLPDAALDPSLFTREIVRLRKIRWKKQKPPITLKSFLKKYLGPGVNLKRASEHENQAWILDGIPRVQEQ
jgi:hypothetical protein